MILFCHEDYAYLEEIFLSLPSFAPGAFSVNRYKNREMFIRFGAQVKNEDCFIIGSTAPPETNLVELLLLAHTLKKESARTVTVLLPYFAYSRHDKNKPGESMALSCIGSLLKASGVDKIITVDRHSKKGEALIPLPLVSVSSAHVFAEIFQKGNFDGYAIAAPDEGAIERCGELRALTDTASPVVYFKKSRTPEGITLSDLSGKVSPQVVLYDDILDTGETLVLACRHLKELGVTDIIVMVTHGLFTGDKWKELWKLNVKKIYRTDTVPRILDGEENIITVSSQPLYKSLDLRIFQ